MPKNLKKSVIEDSELFFKTIGDVSAELDIPSHVLRFWESKFTQIKPLKRKGGHRYYRPDDVEVVKKIRHLLYDQGLTIKGAQKFLKKNKNYKVGESIVSKSSVASASVANKKASAATQHSLFGDDEVSLTQEQKETLAEREKKVKSFIQELESVKDMLNEN